MDKISFGSYISALREKKSISQRTLAEWADVTNSTISRIESDAVTPDPTTLAKIASALEVDKEILLTKCGYSELPEDFVLIARKVGELTEEKRLEAFRLFNKTIDSFLESDDNED